MKKYWLHATISYPLGRLLQGLLPEDEEDAAWRDLVPHRIDHIDELASEDDAEWIEHVRREDGIVVLCLKKRNPAIGVVSENGVCVVALPQVFANMNAMEQAHFLTGAWTDIVKTTHRAKAGTVFKLAAKTGKIEVVSAREC